jgi:hypothetical protein
MEQTCLLRWLAELWWSLRLKVVASLTLPFDNHIRPPTLSLKRTQLQDSLDEAPGRHCRNGYGSLEVGGLRDRDIG